MVIQDYLHINKQWEQKSEILKSKRLSGHRVCPQTVCVKSVKMGEERGKEGSELKPPLVMGISRHLPDTSPTGLFTLWNPVCDNATVSCIACVHVCKCVCMYVPVCVPLQAWKSASVCILCVIVCGVWLLKGRNDSGSAEDHLECFKQKLWAAWEELTHTHTDTSKPQLDKSAGGHMHSSLDTWRDLDKLNG